jgi:hypothetical protein
LYNQKESGELMAHKYHFAIRGQIVNEADCVIICNGPWTAFTKAANYVMHGICNKTNANWHTRQMRQLTIGTSIQLIRIDE